MCAPLCEILPCWSGPFTIGRLAHDELNSLLTTVAHMERQSRLMPRAACVVPSPWLCTLSLSIQRAGSSNVVPSEQSRGTASRLWGDK